MGDESPDHVTQETEGEATQEGSGEVETELSRDMSLFDITFIGVGAMIGAGVFALTGFAAGIAGPALTLAFLLNGIVATFTAVSYAELGAAFPEAGRPDWREFIETVSDGFRTNADHSGRATDLIERNRHIDAAPFLWTFLIGTTQADGSVSAVHDLYKAFTGHKVAYSSIQ